MEMLGDEVEKTIVVTRVDDDSGLGASLLATSHSQYLDVEEP